MLVMLLYFIEYTFLCHNPTKNDSLSGNDLFCIKACFLFAAAVYNVNNLLIIIHDHSEHANSKHTASIL